jgi:hypothetical protein
MKFILRKASLSRRIAYGRFSQLQPPHTTFKIFLRKCFLPPGLKFYFYRLFDRRLKVLFNKHKALSWKTSCFTYELHHAQDFTQLFIRKNGGRVGGMWSLNNGNNVVISVRPALLLIMSGSSPDDTRISFRPSRHQGPKHKQPNRYRAPGQNPDNGRRSLYMMA